MENQATNGNISNLLPQGRKPARGRLNVQVKICCGGGTGVDTGRVVLDGSIKDRCGGKGDLHLGKRSKCSLSRKGKTPRVHGNSSSDCGGAREIRGEGNTKECLLKTEGGRARGGGGSAQGWEPTVSTFMNLTQKRKTSREGGG